MIDILREFGRVISRGTDVVEQVLSEPSEFKEERVALQRAKEQATASGVAEVIEIGGKEYKVSDPERKGREIRPL